MALCPFTLLSVLLLHHKATLLPLAGNVGREKLRWGGNILMALRILERVVAGLATWPNPETPVSAPSGRKQPRRSSFPPHLNLCSTPSVYTSRHPFGSPLAKMWHVYQCLPVQPHHTDAHTNTNTHCLCVSLSGQIRKHDIIFLGVSVPPYRHMHFSMCVWAGTMLMSYLPWWPFLLCWCLVFFINTVLISLDV